MTNSFRPLWQHLEATKPRPERVRQVVTLDFQEFRNSVVKQEAPFVKRLVESLYSGDAYLLKRAFSEVFMANLKTAVHEYWSSKPSEFYPMLEGTPDFHRIIDIEEGKKYSFPLCKHSCYFYPWNDDPLHLFEPVYERWRIIKLLMGLRPDEYERNTPKDGVVDRIQIVRYPPKIGFLEPHSDPYLHQRLFFSGYMSKKGIDFDGIGFYLVRDGDKILEIEDQIDIGDVCVGYASICHGVAPVDNHKIPSWDDTDGRWFLSMYSNASDEVKKRHTGHPTRVLIDGVRPK